jgi:hypothetical protein
MIPLCINALDLAGIQTLKRKNQKALFEALLKVKEGTVHSPLSLFFRKVGTFSFRKILITDFHISFAPSLSMLISSS